MEDVMISNKSHQSINEVMSALHHSMAYSPLGMAKLKIQQCKIKTLIKNYNDQLFVLFNFNLKIFHTTVNIIKC